MKIHYIVLFDYSLISNTDNSEYLKTTITKTTSSHFRDKNELTVF